MAASRSSQETLLAAQSIKLLRGLGFCCIRLQSGSRRAIDGWIHGAPRGTPDWFVVSPFVFLEFKDLAKVSDDQERWHAWAARCNVPVVVVHTPGEAVKAVLELRDELERWERFAVTE